MEITEAEAAILLSTRSAIAVSGEYPIARRVSTKAAALGGTFS
jgi:hypothetical protein